MLVNKILRVNLTSGKITTEELPAEVQQNYLGGKGLVAYYLYHELPPQCDPLGPENKLLVFCGPLTGVMPGHDRYVIGAKSPLTGTFSDSYGGGWFAATMRKAGYIGIIVDGSAEKPVYLKIEGANVTLEDAKHLSGKETSAVDQALPGYRVLAIGPAGENLVKYACVVSNPAKNGRPGVAGRGGLGAVMGSKKLKAIAVKYTEDATAALAKEVDDLKKEVMRHLREEVVPGMGIGGNLGAVDYSSKAKVLPVNNFQRGFTPAYTKLNEAAIEKVMTGNHSCHLCPAACGVELKAPAGLFSGTMTDRLEYETVAMGGSNCGHEELGPIVEFNNLCNELGLDTISTGSCVAFAMECAEKGLIDDQIRFGAAQAQMELVKMIASRKGLGDLLAEGVSAAAKKIGAGAEEFAVHVKGMEIPGYDPRGSISMGLSYGTADRGGCHMRAWSIASEAFLNVDLGEEKVNPFSTEGKAQLVKDLQDSNAALWSLIVCDNLGFSVDYAVKMLDAVGIKLDATEFVKIGERIYNLAQLYNRREGLTRKDDYPPLRFYQAREDTGWSINKEDYETMLNEYYQLRQWDHEGNPTDNILKELNIK